MKDLSLRNVRSALSDVMGSLLDRQVTDPSHPDLGAFVPPESGIASPGSTARLIASCAYLYVTSTLAARGAGPPPDTSLLYRAILAADYLLRAQRPSGLIDLRSTNYDSSPDTGFSVQRLCPVIELGRPSAQRDPAWAMLLDKVETFIRRAVPGMLTGGFHTPNHRWVIASALVWSSVLFRDLDVRETVDAYLAEGFDVDAEGAFLERSAGVYDAVCDRSLLLLAEHWDRAGTRSAALAAAHANLEFNLYLLHADGTVETGLSHRQDYGKAVVPLNLAAPYLHCAHIESSPLFASAARTLWDSASTPSADNLNWLCYVLLRYGEPAIPEEGPVPGLPDDYVRHFPLNGVWRARRGPLSATLFRGATRLLALRFGQAELSSVKISQTYFGVGRFVGDSLEAQEDAATLRSEGLSRPRRPGYEQPLGRPVPPDRWSESAAQRQVRAMPPCASSFTVRLVEQGLELHYRTIDNLDGVSAQIAFDFPPGGVWETEGLCLKPRAGQVLFLKRGYGAMRYGNDVIRIGPGADAHRMWQMRHSEPAPDHVRVLCTFLTPVDHVFSLSTDRSVSA